MRRRLWLPALLWLWLVLLLVLAGCGSSSRDNGQTTSTAVPVETTVQTSATSVDGETVAKAALRLFAEEAKQKIADGQDLNLFQGTTPGPPQPLAEDFIDGQDLVPASWIVPDDVRSATSGMFAVMRPARMSDSHFLVSIDKDGRSVAEFGLTLDDSGRWMWDGVLLEPGRLRRIEDATAVLEATLGPGTEVRIAIFLPSGAICAVGNNGGRETAVWLSSAEYGPGVAGFHKVLPTRGTLYSPSELAALLTP